MCTQTVMRCWDALLSEGTKVLYRVALALLKTHEDVLLAQDNAGYVLREMKLASAAMHDRDTLLKARAVPLHYQSHIHKPWERSLYDDTLRPQSMATSYARHCCLLRSSEQPARKRALVGMSM